MLVKFCEPQFNPINGCKTIRVGTIEYYRTLDPSFAIADPHEGVDSYDVTYSSEVPNEECKRFLANTVFELGESTRVTLFGVNVKRTYPNCYIWCCQKVDGQVNQEDGLALDRKYTSHYIIKDPRDFANHASKRLLFSLSIDNFDERSQQYLLANSLSITDLEITCYFDEIRYVPDKKGAFVLETSLHYNQDLPETLRYAFTKPEKHKPEKEFRFLFEFWCPLRKIPLTVKKDPFDLQWIPISNSDR